MNKTNNKKTNKFVAGALAVGLLATSTFAWTDMKQHKTNTAMGSGVDYSVSIVDIYNPDDSKDWGVGNNLDKEVRIKNEGNSDTHGNAYVRVNLKEYMEIGDAPKDIWTEERFMINADGHHIKSDSFETLQELVEKEGFEYDESKVQELEVEGEKHFYHKTDNSDANGIYGKHVRLKREGVDDVLNAKPVIEGTVRANTEDHHGDIADESNYPSINFGEDSAIRDYVKLPVSENTVMIDEFDSDKHSDGIWILDGDYAYWSNPLEPGQSTTNLVDGLVLVNDPDGAFYYDLHVELEAVDKGDIDKLENLSPKIEDIWEIEKSVVIPEVLEKPVRGKSIPLKPREDGLKKSPTRYMFYDPDTKLFFKNGYLNRKSDVDVISTVDLDNNLVTYTPTVQDEMFIESMRPRYQGDKYNGGKIDVIAAFKQRRDETLIVPDRAVTRAFTFHDPVTLGEYKNGHVDIEEGYTIPTDSAFFNKKGQLVVPTKKYMRISNDDFEAGIYHLKVLVYDVEVDDANFEVNVSLAKVIEDEPYYQNMNIAAYKDGYVMYHLGQSLGDKKIVPGEIRFLDSNFEETSRIEVDLSRYGQGPQPGTLQEFWSVSNIYKSIYNSYTVDDNLFIVFDKKIQKIDLKTGELSEPVESPNARYLTIDEYGNMASSSTMYLEGQTGRRDQHTVAFILKPDLTEVYESVMPLPYPAHGNFYAGAFAEGKFYVSHALGDLTPVTYLK